MKSHDSSRRVGSEEARYISLDAGFLGCSRERDLIMKRLKVDSRDHNIDALQSRDELTLTALEVDSDNVDTLLFQTNSSRFLNRTWSNQCCNILFVVSAHVSQEKACHKQRTN